MSRPIIKKISFGADDLKTFVPALPHNFCLWLTLSIGPEDIEGDNLFQIAVCTLDWLAHQLSRDSTYILRHMMLVNSFDFELISKKLNEIVLNSQRTNWEDTTQILCRYFAWEFEDYQV